MDAHVHRKLGRQVGAKRKNSGCQEIGIFCLSAKTVNSLRASIASFNPNVPRVSAIIVLNTFLLNIGGKSLKAVGGSEAA